MFDVYVQEFWKKILIDEETPVLRTSSMFLPFSGDLNGRRELQAYSSLCKQMEDDYTTKRRYGNLSKVIINEQDTKCTFLHVELKFTIGMFFMEAGNHGDNNTERMLNHSVNAYLLNITSQ